MLCQAATAADGVGKSPRGEGLSDAGLGKTALQAEEQNHTGGTESKARGQPAWGMVWLVPRGQLPGKERASSGRQAYRSGNWGWAGEGCG